MSPDSHLPIETLFETKRALLEERNCCVLAESPHKGSSSFCQKCFGFSAEIKTFLRIPSAYQNS